MLGFYFTAKSSHMYILIYVFYRGFFSIRYLPKRCSTSQVGGGDGMCKDELNIAGCVVGPLVVEKFEEESRGAIGYLGCGVELKELSG